MSNQSNSEEKNFNPEDDKNSTSPEPLFRELAEPQKFPLEALGEILSKAAFAMVDSIQAPDALCGQSLLAAASLAVQAHANVQIDGRSYPTSLFMLTVGQSGERKSAVDSEALKSHRTIEKENITKYEAEFQKFSLDMESWEIAKKKAIGGKKKSKEEIRQSFEELGPSPIPPMSQVFLMDEPTLEGLQKAYIYGRPSVGIFSDEGGRTVGGHGMNSENQLKTAAGMCGLWDGSPITRVRGGDGVTKLYGKRLAMHLMLQPLVAETFISNTTLQDQGLLSRCLIVKPESTVGSRLYKNVNLNENQDIKNYRAKMREILDMPLPINQPEKNELEVRPLKIQSNAYETWKLFHNEVEKKLKDGESFFVIRGFGAKAAEQSLRIAGVLALVEDIEASEIKEQHLLAAIFLMEYYLSEALRLQGMSVLNPDLLKAKKLATWCQQFKVVYASQIYQLGPSFCRDKETALKLIDILMKHGYLLRLDAMVIDRKRRNDVWGVVSATH